MVNDQIIPQIVSDFRFALVNPRILGIILFGSYANGNPTPRSDIDICIVAPNQDLFHMYNYIMEHLHFSRPYDIRFFEELPLYIQGEIMETGNIILTPNRLDLFEYFVPFRRKWADQLFRLKHSI